jgi:hypothetical protein
MMLIGLADVLRAAGLDVLEEPGWQARGHGPMVDVLGVTCHHTANGGAPGLEPSRAVVRDGRPGLDGPLAQLLLRTDGAVRVIAAGLCYHAGVSNRPDRTNSHRIGIEAEAAGVPGTAGDWPAVQMAAYARACTALAAHYGFGLDQVLGHKETCAPAGRKSDPDFDMTAFRAAVAAVDLQEGPDMQWDDKIKLTAADAAIWGGGRKAGDEVSLSEMLRYPTLARKIEAELAAFVVASAARDAALKTALGVVATAVSAIAAGSPDAVKEAFAEGLAQLRAEVASIRVTVDPSPAP